MSNETVAWIRCFEYEYAGGTADCHTFPGTTYALSSSSPTWWTVGGSDLYRLMTANSEWLRILRLGRSGFEPRPQQKYLASTRPRAKFLDRWFFFRKGRDSIITFIITRNEHVSVCDVRIRFQQNGSRLQQHVRVQITLHWFNLTSINCFRLKPSNRHMTQNVLIFAYAL
jgi:hypothetical protein